MNKILKIFFLFPVTMISGFAAHSQSFSTPLNSPDSSAAFLNGMENWIELPEYREQHRLAYKTPDGRMMFHYSLANLCYRGKQGELKPVNCDLKKKSGGWAVDEQQFPSYLGDDGSTSIKIDENNFIKFNIHSSLNGKDLHDQVVIAEKNNVTFWYPDLPVDKKISFRENCVETDYIIHQVSPSMNSGLIFSEEIDLPEGFTITPDNARGEKRSADSWQGDLVVHSSNGNEMARFRMPVYFDAKNNYEKGAYKLSGTNGKYVLQIIVPAKWLNDPQRAFPITIDPLVTGPTATWPGGMMPSCLLPTYNADSILVSVPGQITVTALMVQSSYYGDPFTNTPKGDGKMYFSTNCSSSPILTVAGPQGALPGTAYLPYTNYRSPLLCCFPSVCNPYTFYLTMHLGRDSMGVGCNTSYIYYDPASLWPFSAYIEGHTVESYGINWSVSPTSVCSDDCSLSIKTFVRYGVPPYTVTHPWASGPVVGGIGTNCNYGAIQLTLPLTIPNCPTYCGAVSTLTVPPPTITDACGNVVSGLVNKTVTKNPTPLLTPVPATQSICSGETFGINNIPCVNGSTVNWTSSNGSSGTGNILTVLNNNGAVPVTVSYYATATSPQGCTGPPDTSNVIVNPYPIANAGADQQIETGTTVTLNGSGGTSYSWAPATWLSCTNCQNPDATPLATTAYVVYVTENGCTSTDTVIIDVIFPPLDIFVPNSFTPDGNGVNDVLQVSLLGVKDFEMHIFDRWGEEIYNWTGLNGGWDGTYKGKRVPEGVYVYYYHAIPSDLRYHPMEATGTITVISNGKKQ